MPHDLIDAIEEIVIPQVPAPIGGRLAPSPYNFEFTGEDFLRLEVANSQVGCIVGVHWRLLRRDQQIVANSITFTPSTDRLVTSTEFSIGEGYLLNATVFAVAGGPRFGQTYARLQVIRGRSTAATVLGTLVQGYVTSHQDRAWPGSPIASSLEGEGFLRTFIGTDPAAGGEIAQTVPVNSRWQLLAVMATLVTNATAATRRARLRVVDELNNPQYRSPAPDTQAASLTRNYLWVNGLVYTTAIDNTEVVIASLPTVTMLREQFGISTSTSNLQAGDNWGAPAFVVREWLELEG